MKQLSKENIAAVADLKPGYRLGATDVVILQEMARRQLAAEAQEPYGYVHKKVYENVGSAGLTNDHEAYRNSRTHIPLYAAPPVAQPVQVPECFNRLLKHAYGMSMGNDWNKGTMAEHHREALCKAVEDCRAAMLQGKAEPVSQPCTLREGVAAIRNSGIAIDADKIKAERDALNEPTCWCHTCRPGTVTDMRFVVCPDCGNKRCPRANDHRNTCTGSNEPGQEGSAYPAAPQPESE